MTISFELNPKMQQIADGVLRDGTIDRDEVMRMRQEVFADGVVDVQEADLLFYLNNEAGLSNDPEWQAFFVECLTAFIVWTREPSGFLSEADGQYLINRVLHDGVIDKRSEAELLVNVLHCARSCPEAVAMLTLEAVKKIVLEGNGVLFGPGARRAGVIDATDVTLIRKVIFASGGDGSLTISQNEADLLFDLNNTTAEKDNDPEWRDLFVKSIGHFLMFPSGVARAPTREDAVRREAWLDERRGAGAFLSEMGRATFGGETRKAFDSIFGRPSEQKVDAEVAAQDSRARAVMEREAIDGVEAKWLIDHIRADGILHDNEKALLAFIRENAIAIDPSLEPLMAEAGV